MLSNNKWYMNYNRLYDCNIISLCIFVAKDLICQNFKVTAVKLIFADAEINLLYLL